MSASLLGVALRAGARTKPWQISTNPLLSAPFEFTKSILKNKWLLRNTGTSGDAKIPVDFIKGAFPRIMQKEKSGFATGIEALMKDEPVHSLSQMGLSRHAAKLKPNMIIGMARDAVKLKRLQVQLGKATKGSKTYKDIVKKMEKIVSKEWHPGVREGRRQLRSLPKVERTIKEPYHIRQNKKNLAAFQHGDDIQRIRIPKKIRKKFPKYTGGPNTGERFISGTQTRPFLGGSGDHLVTSPGRHRVSTSIGQRLRQAEINAAPFSPNTAAKQYKLSINEKLEYENYVTKYLNKNIKDAKITDFDDFVNLKMEVRGEWAYEDPAGAKAFLKAITPSSEQFYQSQGLLQFFKQAGISLPK